MICKKCGINRLFLEKGVCDFCRDENPNEFEVDTTHRITGGVEVKGGGFNRRANNHLV